ncbi:hypothetical protein HDU92_003437 [Lobulomyces angularis]|nr:hypothetical protein HDU92_003437 [Lobulomyces angularis]
MEIYHEDVDVNISDLEVENGVNLQEILIQPGLKKSARSRSEKIEKKLKEDEKKSKIDPPKRILILGGSNQGKSTILRQVRIAQAKAFTEEEKDHFKIIIHNNILDNMKNLLNGIEKLGLQEKYLKEICEADHHIRLISQYERKKKISKDIADILIKTWKTDCLKEAWERRFEIANIQDSALVFFEEMELILSDDYVPTNQHIVNARKPTQNITDVIVNVPKGRLQFFDFGGQKSLRKYWLPYFDNAHGILFVVAISSYYQFVEEDEFDTEKHLERDDEKDKTAAASNKLLDSLNIFTEVFNNPILLKSTMILCFNKMDLFEKNLKKFPIKNYFTDFEGDDSDLKLAKKYFSKLFVKDAIKEKKAPFVHFTTSTDTKLMKKIICDILETLIRQSLSSAGFAI